MSLICFACKQDHARKLKHWCDISSLEIQYVNSLKANRQLHVEKQALQKENAELIELGTDQVVCEKLNRLEKENGILREALGFYASFETQYDEDIEPPYKCDGDGNYICDHEYSQGEFKQFGKRARQALKEIGKER